MVALTNKEYQQKISVAESAVADVADPQLKQVAFAKVLEQLLSQGAGDQPMRLERQAHGTAPRRRSSVARGPIGLIGSLVDEGFFQQGKSLHDVQVELQNRGHRIPRTSLSGPLQGLCRRRMLRRMKETSPSGKPVYVYSPW